MTHLRNDASWDDLSHGRRYYDDPVRRRLVFGVIVLLLSALLGTTGFFADRANSLHDDRSELRSEVRSLQGTVDAGAVREADMAKKLVAAQTQLSQLTTDATGKDSVIKTLQDDNGAKQAQIDSLSSQQMAIKGCLDGVTLAMVQLTNNGDSTARATLDGVRDVCRQAEVLF